MRDAFSHPLKCVIDDFLNSVTKLWWKHITDKGASGHH